MFNLKGGVNLKMLMLYSPHNSNSWRLVTVILKWHQME
jgi:hypothetical protein